MTSGTIYLICAVLGALNTANAYRPFSRSGFVSMPVLFAGMLTSELPLQTIGAQVVGTIVFAWAGALDSPAGSILLLEPDGESLLTAVAIGAARRLAGRRVPRGGLAGRALESGRSQCRC